MPSAIFVVAQHTGGQVLGAFAPQPSQKSKMVGFTLALAAVRTRKPFLHSHMTAVLPEYRDRGVGRRLKLFQRQDALKRGIELVEWTFDPLELKNAYFNLALLGAIARRFIPNCYGITKARCTRSSDRPARRRVVAPLRRVKSILADNSPPASDSAEHIPIPSNIDEIKARDPEAAAACRRGARAVSKIVRARVCCDERRAKGATTGYFLEPASGIAGLQLPRNH